MLAVSFAQHINFNMIPGNCVHLTKAFFQSCAILICHLFIYDVLNLNQIKLFVTMFCVYFLIFQLPKIGR